MMPISEIGPPAPNAGRDEKLVSIAEKLEASFLAEMLKAAGLGEARKSFGGGQGEDQFSSFLVDEYAKATVKAGGIGLSEAIYNALIQRDSER